MSQNTPQHLHDKYAWRELPRQDLPKRSAAARIADFLEVYGPYDEETAREQASRCVQCPEPTCVSGCPLESPVPEWMALTAEGHYLEAAALLHGVGNIPEICGRFCPSDRLCEGQCVLEGPAEPVSIWAVEQFLNEYAFAHGVVEANVAAPNGWRVAVLGSGPGGLACADELSRRGYAVTVFDSGQMPGGLLVNSTPVFKLGRATLQRRVEILQKRGVVFRLGVTIGAGLTYEEVKAEFDAIFLAFGAQQARSLEVSGADLKGVVQALPFIVQHNTDLSLEVPLDAVRGKHVAVVGGGDTAMDCLRTAVRCQAREVICVYRRERADMPCSQREYENALEEGAQFVFLAAPTAVLDDGQGRVRGLRLVRTELGQADESGRRPFKMRPGTEFILETDWVVLALGFDPVPLSGAAPFNSLARNERGGVLVDENQMTSIPGVFAGGDLVRGPSRVLLTVRDARRAAQGIQTFLASRERM
jgi:glutamate synthase (NADPH/NADH) small chain